MSAKIAHLELESRWRFWTPEEITQKARVSQWVSNSTPGFSMEESQAWGALSKAGASLKERWEPLLAQTDDLMRAWIGVLEDRQENIAYLWAHMGRPGQTAGRAVAEGLVPLAEPMRCFGYPDKSLRGWSFMPPLSPAQGTLSMGPALNALSASLSAAGEPGAIDRIFMAAQAAWERDALQKHVNATRPRDGREPAPRAPAKRI